MALLDDTGKLSLTIRPRQRTLHGDRRFVDLFAAAGIPSLFEPDMPLWLRCHTPLSIAFESIAVLAQARGNGASWAEAIAVARGLRAGFAIVEALGYRLYPAMKARLNALPLVLVATLFWAISRFRSFRDLLATGRNECRALIETLIAAAAQADRPASEAVAALHKIKPSA